MGTGHKNRAGEGGSRDLLVGWEEPEDLIRRLELGHRQVEEEFYDLERARLMYEDINSEREALRKRQLAIEARELRKARRVGKERAQSALKGGFAHLTGPSRQLFLRFYEQVVEQIRKEQRQVCSPSPLLATHASGFA